MQKFKKHYKLNGEPFIINISEFITSTKTFAVNVNYLIPNMRQFEQYATEDLNEVPKLVQKCEQICRNIILFKFEHLEYIVTNLGFEPNN